MKLNRLWIRNFKNLRNCDVEFSAPHLLNAVIGNNGSGKSNLVEAILHILIGVYFKKPPTFDFTFEFEAQRRQVSLSNEDGKLSIYVDGEPTSVDLFAERLRGGPAQVYYPELTFIYYSGESQRIRRLVHRYQRHFERLTRKPDTDQHQPLFVQSGNEQAQTILLALFAHRHKDLLGQLRLAQVTDVCFTLRSPPGFDPEKHEPKLWNTSGAVRSTLAAIAETASEQESHRYVRRPLRQTQESPSYSERRTYRFNNDPEGLDGIQQLGDRLAKGGDNLYLALERLRARGLFVSASFRLVGRTEDATFEFEQLSEGEKQLLAVVGALKLVNRSDNLVLLDEPDTHLNPRWSWEYPSMLTKAFTPDQRQRSTVLMATHTPIMISGMMSDEVLLAHLPSDELPQFTRPRRHPRGQGIANLLSSSEFFGLPSSLDKETQLLLDERLKISIKQELSEADRSRLRQLNDELEIIQPGVSERDPEYVRFLREHYALSETADAAHTS